MKEITRAALQGSGCCWRTPALGKKTTGIPYRRQLIASVEEAGLACERKSLYRDIAALRQAGMDIRSGRGRGGILCKYKGSLSRRSFTLLADAVEASQRQPRLQPHPYAKAAKSS